MNVEVKEEVKSIERCGKRASGKELDSLSLPEKIHQSGLSCNIMTSREGTSFFRGWYEIQRGRVHTISFAGRFGAIIKKVPQMCPAAGAQDLSSCHKKAGVNHRADSPVVNRIPETGPSTPGIELRGGREQLLTTTYTGVDSRIRNIPVFTGERTLCRFLAGDGVLLRGELLLPLFVGFYHGVRRRAPF